MSDLLTIRTHAIRAAGAVVALAALVAPPAAAQAAAFAACYVPSVGAMYLIKRAGLPGGCLATSHVEVTWTEGGVPPDGSITTVKLADGAVTLPKLAFDPATQAELDAHAAALRAAGTINDPANPVDWTRLKNVPAGIGDGVDDGGVTYSAAPGGGLTLAGTAFAIASGGVTSARLADGAVTTAKIAAGTSVDLLDGLDATAFALATHNHDAAYPARAELSDAGAINTPSNPVAWTKLQGVPAGFADGVDNGVSLQSGSITFSAGLNAGACTPEGALAVTLSGAALGDVTAVGAPASLPANVLFSAFVTAANTVKLRVCNVGTTGVSIPQATWRVGVLR